jgi:hypothetical protein
VNEYLEEAAALLRKAVDLNEQDNIGYPALLNSHRERLAMKFAQLGAIDRGLIPPEMVGDLLALAVHRREVNE